MNEFLENIIVDEERVHVLTKYVNKKTGKKKIVSDHNVMFANFTIKFNRLPRTIRNEIFNLKNTENQKKFFEETSSSLKLASCFLKVDPSPIIQQSSSKLLLEYFIKPSKKLEFLLVEEKLAMGMKH